MAGYYLSPIFTPCAFAGTLLVVKGKDTLLSLKRYDNICKIENTLKKIINKSRQHIKKTSLWPTSSDSGTKMEPYFQKYLSNVISHSSILITKKLPSNEDEVTRL